MAATPRAVEINLKFRRTIKDNYKKDDTEYTGTTDPATGLYTSFTPNTSEGGMYEGVGNVNSGQLTNQEVSDLMTEAINNYLQATVLRKVQIITQRRRNSYSFDELAIDFPEYTLTTSHSFDAAIVNATTQPDLPSDYIYFVSANGQHLGGLNENYRYVTPHTIDQLRNKAFEEDRVSPYVYITRYAGTNQRIMVYRPLAALTASLGTFALNFTYISKQKNIELDVEDALINSFHDSAIIQEMVRLFENKQRLTE